MHFWPYLALRVLLIGNNDTAPFTYRKVEIPFGIASAWSTAEVPLISYFLGLRQC